MRSVQTWLYGIVSGGAVVLKIEYFLSELAEEIVHLVILKQKQQEQQRGAGAAVSAVFQISVCSYRYAKLLCHLLLSKP